jgi:hypothetical protein
VIKEKHPYHKEYGCNQVFVFEKVDGFHKCNSTEISCKKNTIL